MSKTGRKNRKYSAEFKINVIIDMNDNHLSYRETVRKYWQTNSPTEEDKYLKTLKSWERIYLEEGAEGMMKERRGRPSKDGKIKPDSLPKLDKSTEKDIIAEIQRLRAENAYLKKLHALVAERVRQEKKRK